MTAVHFAYWLQGFFELSGSDCRELTSVQVAQIKRHLSLVFAHDIDPAAGGPDVQAKLNALHDANPCVRC